MLADSGHGIGQVISPAMKHAGFLVMFAGSAAIATSSILGRTGNAEPALWLVLCLAGAITFTRTREHPVRYAFPATFAAGLVSPLLQALLFPVLLAHNPAAAEQFRTVPGGMSPRVFILVMAPVVAAAYAGVTTIVTFAVSRMARRSPSP